MLILPKELLTFRKVGKRILLNFATEGDVAEILQIWNESKSLTLREIKRKFSELEDFTNYKLTRGLFYVLSKISDLESGEENADKIREFLFSFGPVLDGEKKAEILKEAEKIFGSKISSDRIWGDLESFRILHSLKEDISPSKLAKLYNTALVLGICTISNKVKIRISENTRSILYYARKLGLMYDADNNGGIAVFGPESVIKNSQRYGLAFAKLINKILKQGDFEFSLELPYGTVNLSAGEIRNFILTVEEEEKFDSTYEEKFFKLVREIFPSVKVLREPEVDISEVGVFIPDFKLSTDENHIFVEIIGFWTPEYLQRKAEKLKRFKKKILLIASEEFALTQLGSKDHNITADSNINVIIFKKELPYLDIIKFLRSNLDLKPDLAPKKVLIPQHILERISSKLYDGMDVQTAKEIISAETDANFKDILRLLDYSIRWESLIPPAGKIVRTQSRS